MKLYRIQVNYKNIYIDETLEGKNDKAVLEDFSNKVASGNITGDEGPGFHDPDLLLLTLEEVDRDATTKVNIGKTSIGVQVGQPSIGSGSSNS